MTANSTDRFVAGKLLRVKRGGAWCYKYKNVRNADIDIIRLSPGEILVSFGALGDDTVSRHYVVAITGEGVLCVPRDDIVAI